MHAWSVGRLVGRSVVRKGSCNRRSVVRKSSCNRRSVVQKCSCSRLQVPKKNPKLGPYEGMRPFPKWVRPTPAMAVEEVSSGEGDVEMVVTGSPERVFSCEATGGAKGTTATEWHGDRGHNRCRDDGASHHHGRGLVSTLPVATGGVELPRPAGAQPNGKLRLLPPVREVAFSGAPAERQPYETDGAVVASRQTCFGDP